MTDLRQAAQQALEALENVESAMYVTSEGEAVAFDKASEAITALREALAQPEQEVSCRFCHDKGGCWAWQCYHCGEIDDVQQPTPAAAQPEPTPWRDMIVATLVREGVNKHRARELADHFAAQPAQEPVAWRDPTNIDPGHCTYTKEKHEKWPHIYRQALYTAPPAAQRPWQGLTDEDMKDPKTHNFDFIYGARWAESKLKERNG